MTDVLTSGIVAAGLGAPNDKQQGMDAWASPAAAQGDVCDTRTSANPSTWHGALWHKNSGKLICRIESHDIPLPLSQDLFMECDRRSSVFALGPVLPRFGMTVRAQADHRQVEKWRELLQYLWKEARVAVVRAEDYELVFNVEEPPSQLTAVAYYGLRSAGGVPKRDPDALNPSLVLPSSTGPSAPPAAVMPQQAAAAPAPAPAAPIPAAAGVVVGVHPDYLETLAHTHSAWVFGALAELIDNSRDALATKLDIYIADASPSSDLTPIGARSADDPMLCVCDNGVGMSHSHLTKMLSLGHEKPAAEETARIGRFGVGFKSGTMRIGTDAVVLTQSAEGRCIALFSRTLNAGKKAVDIPIVVYRRKAGGRMELDTSVHSEEQAWKLLQDIKDVSGFDEQRIQLEFRRLEESAKANNLLASTADGASPSAASSSSGGGMTGTRIYVLKLKRMGGSTAPYELDWETAPGDIHIRSRRARLRNNQLGKDVPIDYSLRAYLKVMFRPPSGDGPRARPIMRMLVQGDTVKMDEDMLARSKVRWRTHYKDPQSGRKAVLQLGFVEEEKEQGRCGIFLYWRDRLIEAYRRVGKMETSNDAGLGVIGVIDTTNIFDGIEHVGVLNCKQRFGDVVEFTELIQWMGDKFDKYWEEKFDKWSNITAAPENLAPETEWVQCDSCEKWRKLPVGVSTKDLPDKWFCYMAPLHTSCKVPGDKEDTGEVTLKVERRSAKGTVISAAKAVPASAAAANRSAAAGGGASAAADGPAGAGSVRPRSVSASAAMLDEAQRISSLPPPGDDAQLRLPPGNSAQGENSARTASSSRAIAAAAEGAAGLEEGELGNPQMSGMKVVWWGEDGQHKGSQGATLESTAGPSSKRAQQTQAPSAAGAAASQPCLRRDRSVDGTGEALVGRQGSLKRVRWGDA